MIIGEVQEATGRHGKYSAIAERVIQLPQGCEFSVYEDGTPADLLRTRLWAAMRANEYVQEHLTETKQRLKFRTAAGHMVYISVIPEK